MLVKKTNKHTDHGNMTDSHLDYLHGPAWDVYPVYCGDYDHA